MFGKRTSIRIDMPEPPEASPGPIKLPAKIAKSLRMQEVDVVRARKDIATLKKMGLKTEELEDRLNWAEEVRKTLLKEFT